MPPRLELIDLDQTALTGYRRFISCWLSRGDGPTFVVDPGPAATAPVLIERLRALGIDHLDFILLTHIHLDHGGATAPLLEAFGGARVVCHELGHRHLPQPERLWAGSRQVLQEVAEVYGEPQPVPARALAEPAELAAAGITVVETPGHAPHHLSFVHQGTLFVGEAAGTFLDLGPSAAGDQPSWYLRPATPPRFRLEIAVRSLDRLLALDPVPAHLAFAHHGLLSGSTRELLERARAQLQQWVAVVREVLAASPSVPSPTEVPEALLQAMIARLDAADPHFARRTLLPPDIQVREEDFTRQTLRGMVDYVLTDPNEPERR
jgi:glyoxylase-like metal-dependent hydrolase (beta-lactamase superfamily II)